jgi:RNA polymerase sigma-70 factor, ECF subfamily
VSQSRDAVAAGSARADRELLDSLAHDPTALGVLYDRYARLVYGIALSAFRNAEEAQDLSQEIFLSLYQQRGNYDAARGTLSGFLVTMTRSRAIDRLRARGRKLRLLQDLHRATPPAPPAFDPLERLSLAQCADRVRAALAELPEGQRNVLELAYYRGLTQSEIATDLDTSLGTVKSWAHRGLQSLARALGDLIE